MKTLAPSILACDMLNFGSEIEKIEKSGSKYVHIDVMDGCFVPNISFGIPIIQAARKKTDLVLDVHAMIVEPDRYIDDFFNSGADILTFHYESLSHDRIIDAIDKIHKLGKKVGLSIKPNTKAEVLIPYLNSIDMVLVMTVEPGFGGQSFMHDMMTKVKFYREYANKHKLTYDIQVDGGINNDTLKIAEEAGANIFVLGTGFFKSPTLVKVEELLDDE